MLVKAFQRACVISAAGAACMLLAAPAVAAVTATGDVDPNDPTAWTISTTAYVGKTGEGSVTVDDGSDIVSRYGNLGYQAGSLGSLTVDGAGSTWTNSANLDVGRDGSGTLSIVGGGAVSNSGGYIASRHGSTGSVTVEGAGSTLTDNYDLSVGSAGTGTLSIVSSGAVTVIGDTYVGRHSGSTGTIHFDNGTLSTRALWAALSDLTGTGTINARGLVTDIDLVFDAGHGLQQTLTLDGEPNQNISLHLDLSSDPDSNGPLAAGYRGSGTLRIADGLSVRSHDAYLGYRSGSSGTATVDGAGSTWTSGGVYVGCHGSGTLRIVGGGAVSNHRGHIGYWSGSTGSVTVDGVGSTWTNSDNVYVGSSSTGVLSIAGGGAVSNSAAHIGHSPGSSGVATVEGPGSTWTSSRNLYVGGSSAGAAGTGTLAISGGGLVSASAATIWQTGSLTGSGGTLCASLTNHGLISPGGSVGVLTVDGPVSFGDSGILRIELAGAGGSPGVDYDQLVVLGSASLAGTLALDLLGGFVPDYLDEVDVVLLAGRSGVFETVDGVVISPALALAVTYSDTAVTVTAARPGNANLDDRVNVGDLGILGANYGLCGRSWRTGDFNGDGLANVADLGIVSANYGWTPAAGAVPEPASAVVLLIGAAAALWRRPRRPSRL